MFSLSSVKSENHFQIQVSDGHFLLGSQLSPVMTEGVCYNLALKLACILPKFSPILNLLCKPGVQTTVQINSRNLVYISHL